MKTSIIAVLFGVVGLVSTSAFALDAAAPASPTATPKAATATPTPSATPTPTMTTKPDKADIHARSQECSKEADALGKHGAERRKFREKCKRGEK